MEKILEHHIDSKLRFRMRMFGVILILLTGALVYEMYTSQIKFLWALCGLCFGALMGVVIGRMFAIRWHPEQKQVVGKLDLLGTIVLVLYILFSIVRQWIFTHWFKGAVLTAFTVSFVEGAMIGRILRMRRDIKNVLIEEGKI